MLADYQKQVMRVCFEREVPQDVLDELGNADRWQLYRQMVRARIYRVVRNALPRFSEALGKDKAQSRVDS